MSENSSFDQLKARLQDTHNLQMAAAVLSWDQEVYMPVKGAAARGAQLSTLNAQAHRLFTASETGQLFEECLAGLDSLSEDERSLLQEAHYDQGNRI
ncbi:MAG: carboxypeptidase M32 [Candidatus Hydrogenedens sp.]|jgi:carboxypeptidase Taq|nr:carboxypeptidase M32 [Candidatus Hydrogenedens sp.]